MFGAAGLAVVRPGISGPQLLLQLRAQWSHHGGTWGVPGGARDSGESAVQAALRECSEEVGALPGEPVVLAQLVDDHGGWSYTTVVLAAPEAWRPHPANAESTEVAWIGADEALDLALHPGLAATWDRLRPLLES